MSKKLTIYLKAFLPTLINATKKREDILRLTWTFFTINSWRQTCCFVLLIYPLSKDKDDSWEKKKKDATTQRFVKSTQPTRWRCLVEAIMKRRMLLLWKKKKKIELNVIVCSWQSNKYCWSKLVCCCKFLWKRLNWWTWSFFDVV